MAEKMFFRLANAPGICGSNGGFLEIAKALDLAQGDQGRQVHRAGNAVDVARLELERRRREKLGKEVFVGPIGDLQPHGGSPLALAEGLFDRREQAALDLVFEDRQVAVPRDPKRHVLGRAIAAEKRVQPAGRSRLREARTASGRRLRRAAGPGG